ncbi:EFR1 family ferrodoxin [[Eubacterium] cellulosolvens]
MLVAIIVFSPTGNTLKVGKMLEKSLLARNAKVQLIDITRDRKLFHERDVKSYLEENIKEHDVLCIGSPVYAHHLHYNVKKLIKSLPPVGNGWGKFSIPFVTYGGINSGIALHEGAKLLKRSGRTNIAGMKINSCHWFTKMKQVKIKINENLPGDEVLPLIEDLVDRIVNLKNVKLENCIDVTKEFIYQTFGNRIKAHLIFREKFWQRHLYPKLIFDYNKCRKCGKCVKVCPVQCIEMTKNGPVIPKNHPSCIHCVSCILNCKFDAICFNVNWSKWNKIITKASKGLGFLASNESPKSAVFPIRSSPKNLTENYLYVRDEYNTRPTVGRRPTDGQRTKEVYN